MSKASEEWVIVAEALRGAICKRLIQQETIRGSELEDLVDAANKCLWLEHNARMFDKNLEDAEAKCYTDNNNV